MAAIPAYTTEVIVGGSKTSFSSLSLEFKEEDSAGNFVYGVPDSDSEKEVWARDETLTVSITGDANVVRVNFLFGRVTLDAELDLDGTDDISVEGHYIPVPNSGEDDRRVARCESYTLDLEADELDMTGFKEAQDNNGARERLMGLFDGSATLSGFLSMGDFVEDAFFDRDDVLLQINFGGSDDVVFRGWFVVPSLGRSGPVDDLESEDVDLSLDSERATVDVDGDTTRYPSSFGYSDL